MHSNTELCCCTWSTLREVFTYSKGHKLQKNLTPSQQWKTKGSRAGIHYLTPVGEKKITIGNFNVQGLSSNPPTVLPAHQLFHWTLLYKGLFQLLCLWVMFHCRPKQQCKFGLSVRILVTHRLSTSNSINGNWRDSDTGRKSRKISNYICFEHASGCWLHRGSKNPTKLWPVNLAYCSKCTLANAFSHSSSPEPEPPPLAKHLMTQTAAPDRIPTAAHRF